jgi:hypothetical protein
MDFITDEPSYQQRHAHRFNAFIDEVLGRFRASSDLFDGSGREVCPKQGDRCVGHTPE